MAPPDPFVKPKVAQKPAEIVKTDVLVGCPAEHTVKCLVVPPHEANLN
jgi:hypothetical protein